MVFIRDQNQKNSRFPGNFLLKHLDLLVMGSHGYTNFKSAVMGSVATHVAAEGNVPLLIIREGSDAPQGV